MTGVYCIKVNDCIVYVGKAVDIEERRKGHWKAILGDNQENKYQLLRAILHSEARIQFGVLEEVNNPDLLLSVEEKWIKALEPCLNSVHNNGRGKIITMQEFWNEIWDRRDFVKVGKIGKFLI